MPWAPTTTACTKAAKEEDASSHAGGVRTVIFVDVDGVLNVGARDSLGGAPLLFSDTNVEHALRLAQGGCHADHDSVQKLVSISQRELGHGEGGTFSSLVSRTPSHISRVLANRLAQLLRAAGEQRTVVLSSSWRRPQHRARAMRLEQEVAECLGEPFMFDMRTPLRDDSTPEDRLSVIGDFLADLKRSPEEKLRVLVLEDFFITPLGCWYCGGLPMNSLEAVEGYLRSRLPADADAAVRLVHTYDEWYTPKGVHVQVGVGLTMEHFRRAMSFLDDAADESSMGSPGKTMVDDSATAARPVHAETISNKALVASNLHVQKLTADMNIQVQSRWMEYLSASLPWLSVSSVWSL